MRLATQHEIDSFTRNAQANEDIYPYLSVMKYHPKKEATVDDWEGMIITNESNTYLLHIKIGRSTDNSFSISLYALNPFAAGRAIEVVKEMVKRYDPISIDSIVHASNIKSIHLHEKIFGKPWGIEPLGAWNQKIGKYEDLHHYKINRHV